jgi:hypothetical protein
MDQDRDLLPWIFGGLSMAAAAIAITVASSNGSAPNKAHAPTQTTAHILPDARALPVPEAEASPKAVLAFPKVAAVMPVAGSPTAPTPAPIFAAAQMQTAAPPTEPTSRVWQCTINGQKTFSDAPCGDKASVREIGPINRMEPSPVFSRTPSYGREDSYQPEYSYPGEQPDSNAGEQPLAGNSYPVFIGIPTHERRRPDHAHRPHEHNRGPQPRRN